MIDKELEMSAQRDQTILAVHPVQHTLAEIHNIVSQLGDGGRGGDIDELVSKGGCVD